MAAASAALFVAAIAVLLGIVLWIVADTQRSTLGQANDDDVATVLAGFRQEGPDEAKEILRQRIGELSGSGGSQIYMRMQGRDESQSLGNLPTLMETLGPVELTFLPTQARTVRGSLVGEEPHVWIMGRGVRLDDSYYLFVGRGTDALTQTRARILKAFLWVMLGSTLVAVIGGIVLATRLIRRVDGITRTCEGIIAGRFNERVASLGAGVEWDRLARAINEMLNRISSLLDNLQQVSSDIAHDLRTPLTRMRHRLDDARHGALTAPGYLRAIDRAIEDSDQILSLFAAVLRIAQIESGSRAGSFRPVDLSQMLQELCALYFPVAEDSGHRLTCSAAQAISIRGDPELLFQMLSNLLENALRHTPKGSHVVLTLGRSSGRIVIEVLDDGAGIPEAEIGKVMRRFYRVEGSRSTPGHGLGLALVNAIAHLHGATLSLGNRSPGLRVAVCFDEDSPPRP